MAQWESEGPGHQGSATIVHLPAPPPLSAPQAGLPPLPGSEVWVQSLLPGLGYWVIVTPSAFCPKLSQLIFQFSPLSLCFHLPTPVPLIQAQGCLLLRAPVSGGPSAAPHVLPPPLPPSGSPTLGQRDSLSRHLLPGLQECPEPSSLPLPEGSLCPLICNEQGCGVLGVLGTGPGLCVR